ncbi:hypothetical protein SAMN05444359_11571 [Neolewinella agarilytica]|uniref:Uncharacterized protein n=1 Tax=Neolewinella agarilytica TaxID=478744 RepID=A0A1H9ING1_9BACT|nr:hypothetical protein SAMN05444359_11571 [Neolewinella agarilytica]
MSSARADAFSFGVGQSLQAFDPVDNQNSGEKTIH